MKRVMVSILGLALIGGPAWAQPDDDKVPAPGSGGQAAGGEDAGASDKPWEQGVSAEDKDAAKELTREGNQLVKEYQWASAAEKYRQALSHWDHPAIHYNLAMALLNLDQPLELYKALIAAMKYGPEGIGAAAKWEKATREKERAEALLARIKVTTKQPGVVVTIDGNQVLSDPGTWDDWVVAGSHTVKATKTGFITTTEVRKLVPGEVAVLNLELKTAAELTAYHRKWPVWMPWSVFGGGVLVSGIAAFLHSTARTDFRKFDDGIAACGGCVPDASLADKKSSAETKQTLAIIGYGVGGAALVAGAVLLYVNRAKPYRLDEDTGGPAAPATAAVTPWFAPDSAGVSASFRF